MCNVIYRIIVLFFSFHCYFDRLNRKRVSYIYKSLCSFSHLIKCKNIDKSIDENIQKVLTNTFTREKQNKQRVLVTIEINNLRLQYRSQKFKFYQYPLFHFIFSFISTNAHCSHIIFYRNSLFIFF